MTFLRIIRKPARPVVLGLLLVSCLTAGARVPQGGVEDTAGAVIRKLQAEYGPEDSARISRGVGQVASRWRPGDGDFEAFCTRHFIPSGRELDSALAVIERQMEVIRGHQREIDIALDLPVVTRSRPVTELDRLFSTTKPEVDYFQNGLALAIALNFPYYTLAEKERMGAFWSRREWAMVRAGDLFRTRPGEEKGPEPVTLPDELRDYTSLYILSMDHVLSPDMEVMFPEGTRLNCHNGLRDEIKGLYSRQDPLPRQRLISTILIHILNQTIPECMIGPTGYYWEPAANRVFLKKDGRYAETAFTTENDRRYQVLHHRMVSKMRED
ncbi:MAG: hypothetical protein EHM46_05625, partial [Bacteroidetes bacterium]